MKRTNLVKGLTLGVAVVTSSMVLTACGSKDTAKKTTENRTTATQTTETTQTTQETQPAETETKIEKVDVKDGEFAKVMPEDFSGNFRQIGDYYFGIELKGVKYAELKDYDKNEYDLYCKRVGDKEPTVIQHYNFGSVSLQSIYSDGKEVIYGCDNKLYRYDIETKKSEETDLYKTLDNISEKSRSRISIMDICDGNAYINFKACDIDDEGELIGDSSEPIDFVIIYNLESKTAKCVEIGRRIEDVVGEYIITSEGINVFKDDEKTTEEVDLDDAKYYVETVAEDGLKEVAEIGDKTGLCDNNKVENKKIYFETNIVDNGKTLTLTSFDKESGKIEKVAELNTDMFGEGYKYITVIDVTDEDCTVSAFNEEAGSTTEYKYIYETGAIQ
ncbi:hypothetical protein [uncultured Eubacterium sp.]|uniref:hypothetical protein n=1 Tax=uncultured Eubacterium sp. TaxID=165185 RepID=UPI000E91E90A|nr:hypothetical protein [uncultured Eubacterium sp.]HAH18678.1 hypothetical protein [Eubacterium sp.]HAV91190.1 hypothetical protein [Eubacterium sp.]